MSFQDGTLKSEIISNDLLPNINKVVAAALSENANEDTSSAPATSPTSKISLLSSKSDSLSPVIDFLEGRHCLTGVSTQFFINIISNLSFQSMHYLNRELAGGNMNFVMVVTLDNFTSIKLVKRH